MRISWAAAVLCLAALAVLVLAAAPAAADGRTTIADGTAWNSERKVAAAPDGTVYVSYVDRVNGTTAVFVKRSTDDGNSWTVLPQLSTAEAFRVCVAVDSTGRLHVAWTEVAGANRQLFYARLDGASSWTPRLQISDTPGYSGYPSIGVDSADRIHVVWYGFDGANYQIYYRYLDGAGWHDTVQATHGADDANNPAIAIGPDDVVHVAFFSVVGTLEDVYYMAGGPSGWSLERVNPARVPSSRPSIVVHDDGRPAIAYASGNNASVEVRVAERDVVDGWSSNVGVSLLGEGADNPSLAADDAGNLAVFYETAAGDIRYRARIGANWSEPVTVSAVRPARWPSASWARFPAETTGVVRVVWTEESASTFFVNFTSVRIFPTPVCHNCDPDPLRGWGVPLLFVGAATAAVAAVAIASYRTKGGGRP